MPNLDSGHYFFSALVPVWNDGIVQHVSVGTAKPMKSSPIHMVREALETLPTALQSRATEAIGINSPFARSNRTHFARFAIIDQPNYNGRDPENALLEVIRNTDLLAPQPNDQLTCPYIIVSIDFDPSTLDAKDEPRSYLEELWTLMPQELTAVFQYCYGFHADPARGYPGVTDAKSFADFLIPCQIETTMSFNDYYTGPPPLRSASLTPFFLLAATAVLGGLVTNHLWHWASWGMAILAAVALLILVVLIGFRYVLWFGGKAFPGNPDATLPHVLKGLYLQQAFVPFAAAQQGRTQDERGAAFRAFLETHRPADLAGPTQSPGVIRSTIMQVAP
ncbi:hypothetical protein [Sphingomonas sanguinis]|uniref:Uncharacterized protein n=1 Tax=Sphingomonas sanguinis TaxID=33051 RepID=A0A147JBQ6_9SPHN|nr:hypothetical protein [Sphingomonas sanguinis]KTW16881.1 hypothetical protein NS258_03250 [Sphingomonas sanguinis]